jgi:hypothetical protein
MVEYDEHTPHDCPEPCIRVLQASSFAMQADGHQWTSADFTLLVRPPANRLPATVPHSSIGTANVDRSADTLFYSVVVVGTCRNGQRVEYVVSRRLSERACMVAVIYIAK